MHMCIYSQSNEFPQTLCQSFLFHVSRQVLQIGVLVSNFIMG